MRALYLIFIAPLYWTFRVALWLVFWPLGLLVSVLHGRRKRAARDQSRHQELLQLLDSKVQPWPPMQQFIELRHGGVVPTGAPVQLHHGEELRPRPKSSFRFELRWLTQLMKRLNREEPT